MTIVFRAGAALVIAALFFLILPVLVVSTDRAYICEITGSRKGFREWFFNVKTSDWYRASKLEQFVKEQFPAELQHRWTAYAGTERNIFGGPLHRRHDRPGPLMEIPEGLLNEWFDFLPDREKRMVYDLLLTGDKKAITTRLNAIWDDLDRRGAD